MYHETHLRVRYAETDKMGIVHHSNHPIWWEMARCSLLRDIGLPYSRIEAEGIACPLVEIYCRYHYPAYFEDELVVRTAIRELSPVKIRFEYHVLNRQTGQLIASGESLQAFTDITGSKPVRLDKYRPQVWKVLWGKGKQYLVEGTRGRQL